MCLEAQILRILLSALLWVRCMEQSAQKNPAYATAINWRQCFCPLLLWTPLFSLPCCPPPPPILTPFTKKLWSPFLWFFKNINGEFPQCIHQSIEYLQTLAVNYIEVHKIIAQFSANVTFQYSQWNYLKSRRFLRLS